jgi:ABC-2 type transport system permease protein
MKGLTPLLKKEIKEQIKTHRLLIVGGVFLCFGLMAPLLQYFMPQILKMASEQVVVEIPPATSLTSFTDFASYFGQFGILIAVLVAMGAIANELKHGTALITLSKPVSSGAFVFSKFVAISLTLLVSQAVAAIFCFGYTVWLIGEAAVLPFLWMNLLMALFLIFCLALTIVFSSLFKSSLAAGGIAVGTTFTLGFLSSLPVIGEYLPSKIIGWGVNLLGGTGETYWGALVVTVVGVFVCLYSSQRILKRKEI